jgi:hypothetical protein
VPLQPIPTLHDPKRTLKLIVPPAIRSLLSLFDERHLEPEGSETDDWAIAKHDAQVGRLQEAVTRVLVAAFESITKGNSTSVGTRKKVFSLLDPALEILYFRAIPGHRVVPRVMEWPPYSQGVGNHQLEANPRPFTPETSLSSP